MATGHRFPHRAVVVDLIVTLPAHHSPQPHPPAPLSPISAASHPTLKLCILICIKVSFWTLKKSISWNEWVTFGITFISNIVMGCAFFTFLAKFWHQQPYCCCDHWPKNPPNISMPPLTRTAHAYMANCILHLVGKRWREIQFLFYIILLYFKWFGFFITGARGGESALLLGQYVFCDVDFVLSF